MLFNVLRELRQSIGSVNEFDLDGESVKTEDGEVHSISGVLRLLRTDRGLLAKVTARGVMSAKCARCLTDVETPVDVEFEEEYVPMVDANTGAPVRVAEDDDVFRISPRFELDLREAFRQYILISEPAKPLCRAACLGLCAICGADLNAGDHEEHEPSDERWSALAALKKDIPEGN